MSTVLFGQALSRFVRLSPHDVNEILEEQAGSRRRFGDIALAWGLCTPQNVWQAWCEQIADGASRVELDAVGVDAQAVSLLPTEAAHRLNAIAIRCIGDTVIIATAHLDAAARLAPELRAITGKELRFVEADATAIQHALINYYPAAPNAA